MAELFQVDFLTGAQPPYFFLVSPDVAPPDLGPCDGSGSQSGCAQTPEPINPASGDEGLTEHDDYRSGDGRLRLTRTYNSTAAAAPSMPYSLGFGWQNNFAGRQLTWTNQISGLLTQFSVSKNYTDPSTACTQGWLDVAPGQPNSAGVTATYSASACHLSNGQSWPVYSNTVGATAAVAVAVRRPSGATYMFACTTTSCTGNSSVALSLTPTSGGFTLTDERNTVEQYNSNGVLQSLTNRGYVQTFSYSGGFLSTVTDSFGRALSFTYGSNGQLQTVTTPSGQIQYGYDTAGRLLSVTYPDGKNRTYAYGNTQYPYALTSVVDESGTTYASIAYDSSGRGLQSSLAGGAWASSVNYTTPTAPVVTDAFGVARTYQYTTIRGRAKLTSIAGPVCNTCNNPASITYDSAGYYQSKTDWNGNVTRYVYDDTRGLETSRTEAYGTAQARTITTTWNATWRQPALITKPNRTTGFTYDSLGNALTKTITDTSVTPNVSRTWRYTYDSYGRMLSADGPRTDVSDVTTYAYYTCTTGFQCGQIETITSALVQITTFNTYNAHGQPLTITDPNGVVTTLTYDARQRLKSREVGTETIGYSYYPTGLLQTVTLPDSSTIAYGYDGAHRLTDITDSLGNRIHYTVDAMGNGTAENAYDPSNLLHLTHTRVINALNELQQDVNAAGTSAVTTTFGYDNNGNRTSIAAPLSRNTSNQYDALNRPIEIMDPASGITHLGYDANDNLASVQDPRSLTTAYTHNGFGDVTKRVSPDTGTSLSTYDSGGNLETATDARGAVATLSYDALNRVIQIVYTDQTIHFTYDAGANGKGRLSGASDANHSLSWTHDTNGRVTGKGQTVGSVTKNVGYAYTNADLTSVVTPSGQTIRYGYADSRITSISLNGTPLLTGVTYEPFGPVHGWTWGNASTVSRTYNEDGNVSQIATAGDVLTFGYDDALRISSLSDTLFSSSSYSAGYDALNHLNSLAQTGVTSNWTYDADGNHLTQTGTSTVTTTPSTSSNRLNSISGLLVRTYAYDSAGNTLSYTGASFGFNQRGRMSSATVGSMGASYIYNALGQLIEKTAAGVTTLLMYDEAGHLLGEYSSTGALIQETVWMGDVPVATLRPNGSTVSIYYVHTDHLNAPRVVTQSTDNSPRWLWGGNAANQNPLGLGTFVYNLRYPGQYFQAETGLNYNYFRDYDPATGRYIESDPIGLKGGINTYVYAGYNPINRFDRRGLDPMGDEARALAGQGALFAANPVQTAAISATILTLPFGGEGGLAIEGAASLLDTNAVIAALEGGNAAAVDLALGGAAPYVSPTVIAEFAAGGGDLSALEAFLSARGGGVLAAETEANAAALQAQAAALGRSLQAGDAAIASSAQVVGIGVITNDAQFLNFLIQIGIAGGKF